MPTSNWPEWMPTQFVMGNYKLEKLDSGWYLFHIPSKKKLEGPCTCEPWYMIFEWAEKAIEFWSDHA